MAPKLTDVLLEKGMAGIVIEGTDPATGEPEVRKRYLTAANYPATRPGVQTFAAELAEGKLHEAHGDATPEEIVVALFSARFAEAKKSDEDILKALAGASEAAQEALKVAKVQAWRDALDELDVQADAKKLYARLAKAEAALAKVQADVKADKSKLAETLKIDPVFDLTLLESGWYIPSETTNSSGGGKRPRNWLASDEYEQTGTIGDGVAYTATATIKDRETDKPWRGSWTVVYKMAKGGKTYKAEAKTLNTANSKARAAMMAVHAPENKSPNQNCPEVYGVPLA